MSTRGRALDSLLASAPTGEDRIAWFGALLAKESGTEIEIVGGSAIEIYLTARAYVSQDIDIVGMRAPIVRALRRWGFREVKGRSSRAYWLKEGFGLVDLVGPKDRSGLPALRRQTPHGLVLIGAVEPLIVRRLWRSARERSAELFSQALRLARGRHLDWGYLEAVAGYEGVLPELERLKRDLRK